MNLSVIDIWDRVVNRFELWGSTFDPPNQGGRAVPLDDALTEASSVLGSDLRAIATDRRLQAIEGHIASSAETSLPAVYDAPRVLRTLCYVLCRALEPVSVVETGVANGATSACILAALEEGARGRLYSIDWMPGGRHPPVGDLVPEELRTRWELEWGPSRRLLPKLLRRIDPPALFIHDSDHTYRNMRRELVTVAQRVPRPGAILVDDVQRNASFAHWVDEAEPAYSACVADPDDHLVGLAILV